MKLKLSLIFAAAIVVLMAAFLLQPGSSIDAASFHRQFREALRRNGYTIYVDSSCNPQNVPLPLSLRWHPRYWLGREPIHVVVSGFPNGAERYTLARDGTGMLDCFVRYLDDRACFIRIQSHTSTQAAAMSLRSILADELPGLPIRISQ